MNEEADTKIVQLTPRQRSMIEEYFEIEREDARSAGKLGYMARVMAQATLPHSDPKLPPGTVYTRNTGQLSLHVAPTTSRYGVPYGTIPRVTLAWICTESVRTKSRELNLGRSQAEFIRKLEMHSNGRDIKRLREQCLRLFRSTITVEYVNEQDQSEVDQLLIARNHKMFWHKQPDIQSLWPTTLLLTEDFYDEATNRAVPIDLRVYHALSKSPLAMDIYTWLTYRMFVLRVSGRKDARVPWLGLKAQLGSGIADTAVGLRLFKSRFMLRLREVLLFYPEANGHLTDQGSHLRLTPCALHLPPPGATKRLL